MRCLTRSASPIYDRKLHPNLHQANFSELYSTRHNTHSGNHIRRHPFTFSICAAASDFDSSFPPPSEQSNALFTGPQPTIILAGKHTIPST